MGVSNHAEDTFSFLNRSARPACEKVRSTLNIWYKHYPDGDKVDLKKKFQDDFSVGFFELFLHELLYLKHQHVDVHPKVSSDQKTHPDFRVQSASEEFTFLEASIVNDGTDEEKAQEKVLKKIYDQINGIEISDYFLHLEKIYVPNGKQPSGKKLRAFILGCIRNLNYDNICIWAELGAFDQIPSWKYTDGQFELEFSVIPVSSENRGKPDHHVIGIYPGGVPFGGMESSLRSKINKKATKYGQLNCQYVIAVNCLGKLETNRRDELSALFGTENPSFRHSEKGVSLEGKLNGAWYGPRGPKNTRVSAVIFTRLFPWNLSKATVTLYHNPWAQYEYIGPLTELPQVKLVDDKLESIRGNSFGSIFSLSDDWPGQLFED